jgi:hypothetical protein
MPRAYSTTLIETLPGEGEVAYVRCFVPGLCVHFTEKYLYRAVDSDGRIIEFMPSAKRDVSAAKRFFKKLKRADHRRLPFTIGID